MNASIVRGVVTGLLVVIALLARERDRTLITPQGTHAQRVNTKVGTNVAGGTAPARCPTVAHGGTTPFLCSVYITGSTVLTLDERTGRVFVAREKGDIGYVSMFDARSGALLRTVTVGEFPLSIAADVVSGHVFVTNQGSRSVSMLDARTGTLVRTTRVRGDPITLAVDGRVVALDAHDSNVNVLAATSGRLVATVPLHRQALTVAVAEHTGRIFVADNGTTTVLDARTGRVRRTVPGAAGPMVVDERTGRVYTGSGAVLDARSGAPLALVVPFGGALTLALDPQTARLIATTSVSIDLFDARSGRLLHSVSVDTQPASAPVVIGRTGHILVLLSNPIDDNGNYLGPGYLLVVDERSGQVVRRINASGVSVGTYGPSNQIAVDNQTNRAFVLDGHGLDVFDTTRL